MDRLLLVPAAGSGSRLGAAMPKLLVSVAGRPMISHILALYASYVDHAVLVVAPSAVAAVRESLGNPGRLTLLVQDTPTGMLDAILLARDQVRQLQPRRVLITWCDQIAIAPATVRAVVSASETSPEPPLVMPVCRSAEPYVHLVRDSSGRIVDVLHRREGDEMPLHGESDAGVFDLSRAAYLEWLPEYAQVPDLGRRTGERNFVPFVATAAARGTVVTIPCRDRHEAIGINTAAELAAVEAHLRARSVL